MNTDCFPLNSEGILRIHAQKVREQWESGDGLESLASLPKLLAYIAELEKYAPKGDMHATDEQISRIRSLSIGQCVVTTKNGRRCKNHFRKQFYSYCPSCDKPIAPKEVWDVFANWKCPTHRTEMKEATP